MDVNYPTAINNIRLTASTTSSNREIDVFLQDIKKRSDNLMNYFLASFFIGGLLLSYFYDTSDVAIGIGLLSLIAYYSAKIMLPHSTLYQYVLSTVFGIFMAQYIFQMHGLFEMHFVAFIGSAILITYQNWKLQIPIAVVVVVHHALFGYLQFIGYDKIYFTQLDYMDLQTFGIHAFLAAVIFFICGLWAHHFKKYSSRHIEQTFEMGRLQEEKAKQQALFSMSENLKVTNEQMNEAQQMASIGSWMWDMRNNHVDRSEEFYNILQRTPDEIDSTPQGFLSCVHPEEREALDEQVRQCIADDAPFAYEARLVMPDKKEKNIFAQGKAIKDENGNIIKMHGTIQDITKRKAYEQVLEKTNSDLRKTNHELDKFVYSVSHDLRAPLLSMQGVVDITADETTEELTAAHMQMLKGSIARLDNFVGEILNYSRNARGEIKTGDVDFKKIISEITDDLKYMASDTKHVEIAVNIEQNSHFNSDEGRIRVIVNNLVSNAIRYHNPAVEQPYVNIKVSANELASVIEISDNGIGIPEKHQQKVFDMFYRVSEKSRGSGLGLYIVKETLDKIQGDIQMESQVGAGTKFTIHIPNLTTNN